VKQIVCAACGQAFPSKLVINGKIRSLYRRRFCLRCSAFGSHNTSKVPPAMADNDELREHRRRRRNAKTYRYQKKRRKHLKLELIETHGGR
jgi:type II secretory ATPase GspE/PulE/Tfp pilus assembly ATPase PilB-like protein